MREKSGIQLHPTFSKGRFYRPHRNPAKNSATGTKKNRLFSNQFVDGSGLLRRIVAKGPDQSKSKLSIWFCRCVPYQYNRDKHQTGNLRGKSSGCAGLDFAGKYQDAERGKPTLTNLWNQGIIYYGTLWPDSNAG